MASERDQTASDGARQSSAAPITIHPDYPYAKPPPPTPRSTLALQSVLAARAKGQDNPRSVPAAQPIPIPPAKGTIEHLKPSLASANDIKKAAAAVEADRNAWFHRRHRHPALDARVRRHVESQADYKIGGQGYARIKEGDFLNHGRYEVLSKLGIGHFSCVYLCWDREEGGHRAVKVIRSNPAYFKAGFKEDQLLTVLQGPKDDRRDYLIHFLDSFEHPDPYADDAAHYCLVFEVLGMSLGEVLRANKFAGLPLNVAKSIIKQCLLGLSYLHSLSIVHTDIKPDNILLKPDGLEDIIRKQLRAERIARLQKEEHERLRPDLFPPKQPYIPKAPGLTPEQVKQLQDVKERVEREKWDITPAAPIASPIDFVKGHASPARSSPRVSASYPGVTVTASPSTPGKRKGKESTKSRLTTPPPPMDLQDSGFKADVTLGRKPSASRNTSPLLARAIAAHESSGYAYGAPLQRYPSRHYVAKPMLPDELASMHSRSPSEADFSMQDQELSVRTTATAAGGSYASSVLSKKGSPLAMLDTQICHANLVGAPTSSFAKSVVGLVGSQLSSLSITRTSSASTHGPRSGSGSGSSQNGEGWLSSSFMSARGGGSSSSLESSFTSDSALQGLQTGSPAQALNIRWERDNTPHQPSYGSSRSGFPSSSSPAVTKYGMPMASSASMEAMRSQGSIFRPHAIPHPLLAPYQPMTIAERLRQLAAREDALHAQATGKQEVATPAFDPAVKVRIADLGNALFFADAKANNALPAHVCTRYYREPGNIIGAEYDLGIDIFALGCTLFELVTGDLLFNPESRRPAWTKDDDQLAQQIELLGNFSVEFALCGERSWKFFDGSARLKRKQVEPYHLFDVLHKAYRMPQKQARSMSDFLLRMLEPVASQRATADELLQDPWLNELEEDDGYVVQKHKCTSACKSTY